MRAVILAGGAGSRLGKMSDGKPKCLLRIGGRPLIKHQLEALADNGVGPVMVVLGYKADEVRGVVGDRAEYVVNDRYDETNSLYSFWLAREWVKGPFVLLNSDLFFHPYILAAVLNAEGNALAYDSTSARGKEQTKVALKNGRVLDLGKDLPPGAARGESLGLIKFDEPAARIFVEQADHQIRGGHEKSWVTEALRSCCAESEFRGVNIAGLPWVEVDFPYDLEEARREVWPAIRKSLSPGVQVWKYARWALLGLALVALPLLGWFGSSEVGPASVEWDTLTPAGVEKVRLDIGGRTQKWWRVERDRPAEVQPEGGRMVRVYTRAILPGDSKTPARCLVEMALDGEPLDWEILNPAPDPAASLAGAVVGERDRLVLTLPPGEHTLTVALAGGPCRQLLVRIRQEE